MIEIKPHIQHQSNCPYCQSSVNPIDIVWQGMYVCVTTKCVRCTATLIESLEVGHFVDKPFQIDINKKLWFTKDQGKNYAEILLNSLANPESEEIFIAKEVFQQCKKVIILNCIDYLYGHCVLKLLNAQRYLDSHPDYGLIIIIPKFLRWMVPEHVAEIWTVTIPLKNGLCYYPSFAEFVTEELKRFDNVYVSKAHSHPSKFDINKFTGVIKHSFDQEKNQITFIWREDRMWTSNWLFRILKKLKLLKLIAIVQNWKVRCLFSKIKTLFPSAQFAIAGLGTQTNFPLWITDLRVDSFDEETERKLCQLFSETRLVIGIHGSNMLLPSGHAGMTLDLMPEERWGNFAQDILYQESDPRLAAFRYRYLPLNTNISLIAKIALSMLVRYRRFYSQMTADQ